MKFFAIAALFAAGALAHPLEARTSNSDICPSGLYSVLQCCNTDVLGVINLNCQSPINSVHDARSFREECARYGKQSRCCVLPVAGQAVLCQAPAGSN